jgi:hypothetical protein
MAICARAWLAISSRRLPTVHLLANWPLLNQLSRKDDLWAICQFNLNHAEFSLVNRFASRLVLAAAIEQIR